MVPDNCWQSWDFEGLYLKNVPARKRAQDKAGGIDSFGHEAQGKSGCLDLFMERLTYTEQTGHGNSKGVRNSKWV